MTILVSPSERLANSENLIQGSERTCDAEPIHIPGSIQPHGLLLLFDASSGKLAHRAGDIDRLLGLKPVKCLSARELLGMPLADLIGAHQLIPGDEPVHVGCIRPKGRGPLAMMAHRTGRFVAVELMETADEGSAASALDRVNTIYRRIAASKTLADACNIAAEQMRSIVGFDSVMVYRFLDDDSGSVIAESRAAHAMAYLGHRFPASDIPCQARDLYRRNLIRVIPDVTYQPATIEPAPSGPPVDMSHCALRSVSPVHIQYLKNMGVGASMSISLMVEGELWGLIACHHYEPRNVRAEAQLLCRQLGTSLSAFILSFQQAETARLGARQTAALDCVLQSMSSSSDPERRLRTSCEELMQLVDCGGFVLIDDDGLVAGAGQFPGAEKLHALSALVEAKLRDRQNYSTDRLGEDLPGTPAIATHASGVLAVRLEAWSPLLALWLRPERVEEIDWAGDPRADSGSPGRLKSLTPRRSFATWRKIVSGRSRPWFRHEIAAVELFQTRVSYAMQRHRLIRANAELSEANAILNKQATTDPLTGLPNRRLFDKRLHSEWERALRQNGMVALVAIDIDNFKKYNDFFGHPAGDECLKQVARAIGAECRSIDVAARLGGEEFVILLPGIDASGAASVAERIRAKIQELGIDHPNHEHGVVTISLGVAAASPSRAGAVLPLETGTASGLMSAADQALYEAKANGRNRVAVSG